VYLDSYDRIERRLEIEKIIGQAKVAIDKTVELLALGKIKEADDYLLRVKHLREQAEAQTFQLKQDLEA
jgi:hypothetical protein